MLFTKEIIKYFIIYNYEYKCFLLEVKVEATIIRYFKLKYINSQLYTNWISYYFSI